MRFRAWSWFVCLAFACSGGDPASEPSASTNELVDDVADDASSDDDANTDVPSTDTEAEPDDVASPVVTEPSNPDEPSNDGGSEAVPPRDDAGLPVSPCDPRVGCGEGLVCDAASCGAPGVCRVPPDVECGPAYAPVCGCDGVTYGNPCAVAGGPYEHDGACPTEAPDCVAAIDEATCCLVVVAVTRSELDVEPCLVEAAGADLQQVSREATRVCQTPEQCGIVDCEPMQWRTDFFSAAVATEAGVCELTWACDDATCPGGRCDPRVGCSEGLVCTAGACDVSGACLPIPETDCGTVYNPVCGCDGVTYDNSCSSFRRAVEHDAECAAPE